MILSTPASAITSLRRLIGYKDDTIISSEHTEGYSIANNVNTSSLDCLDDTTQSRCHQWAIKIGFDGRINGGRADNRI